MPLLRFSILRSTPTFLPVRPLRPITQFRFKSSVLTEPTSSNARESAGESKRSPPINIKKTAGMDPQSAEAQAGLREYAETHGENAARMKEKELCEGGSEDASKEFPESPAIIGMQDERGHKGGSASHKPCQHEGIREQRAAKQGNK